MTGSTEKACDTFKHVGPPEAIAPGWLGTAVVTVILMDRTAPLPQLLFAFTVISPEVVPAIVVIVLVVEFPVQPEGRVHV